MFQQSLFSKLYSYRERENKHSKENFLIEILAHCLGSDMKLSNDFFNLINLKNEANVSIKTQSVYDFGRPDIEINFSDNSTCVLIECKIEHFERENQLEDYKRILESKSAKNKHLIYLTKYYDLRENNNRKIKFHQLRWQDIYELINNENSQFSKELKQYIKDENMSESQNFTYTDLAGLKNITGTIRKMDEVLDGVKEYYEEKIGKLSKDSSRSSRIKDEWYATYETFSKGTDYSFSIRFGFMWWDDEIYLGAEIFINQNSKYKKSKECYDFIKKTLRGWDEEVFDDSIILGKYNLVAQFIIDEDEQIPAMIKFLKDCVNQMEKLKINNPRIFK